MLAAILQALPIALRTQVQLQVTETATYEQLKEKIMHYESISARWDSTNSLQMPIRQSDEAAPMEIDVVSKGKKGKSKNKGKDDGKSKCGSMFKGVKEKYDKGKSKGKDKGKDGEGKDARPACHHSAGEKGILPEIAGRRSEFSKYRPQKKISPQQGRVRHRLLVQPTQEIEVGGAGICSGEEG